MASDDSRCETARNVLRDALKDAADIVDRSGNPALMRERLARWKRRTSESLQEHFATEEARRFSNLRLEVTALSPSTVIQSLQKHQTFLLGLLEDLNKRGERVLCEVKPPGAERQTATSAPISLAPQAIGLPVPGPTPVPIRVAPQPLGPKEAAKPTRVVAESAGDPLDRAGFRQIRFLRDHGSLIGLTLSPIALTVAQQLAADEGIAFLRVPEALRAQLRDRFLGVFIVLAGLWAVFAIMQWRKEESLTQLEDQLSAERSRAERERQELEGELRAWEEDIALIIDGYLLSLARILNFQSTERITIYTRDHKARAFVRLARYSPNPKYNGGGREYYPEAEGRIAQAWEKGDDFAADYPDFNDDPEGYLDRCEKDGLSRDHAGSIKMKSRMYFGWRIKDPTGQRNLAVVIVESLDPAKYHRDHLLDTFRQQGQVLRFFAERMRDRVAQISSARERRL